MNCVFECGTIVESLTTLGDGTLQFQNLLRTRRESDNASQRGLTTRGVCVRASVRTSRAINSPSSIGRPPFPLDCDSGMANQIKKRRTDCA